MQHTSVYGRSHTTDSKTLTNPITLYRNKIAFILFHSNLLFRNRFLLREN